MSKKNFRLLFATYFIIFGVIITMLGAFISYNVRMTDVKKTIGRYAQETSLNYINNTIKPTISKMDDIAVALTSDETLKEYIKTRDKKKIGALNNLFLTVAMSEKNIMQARYLDAKGKEIIRINRDTKQSLPYIVPKSKLQNKSLRDYFVAIKKMPEQTIWHSDIDLNIENGKIEVPYRSTLRIAIPLFKDHTFCGTVIINMLTNELFSSIGNSPLFDVFIIDRFGNYILHPQSKYSWNKYTQVKRDLYQDFPQNSLEILSGKAQGDDFFAYNLNDILKNDDHAILILKPKSDARSALKRENLIASFIVALLSILLSIPLALYVSSTPSKLQKALHGANIELQRFANIIDKYVVTATTNSSGVITSVSTAFSKVSGYTKDELIGQKMDIISNKEDQNKLFKELWNTILQGEQWHGEINNKTKEGKSYWLEQTIIPIKDEEQEITSFMAVGNDITAKKELEVLSVTDKLTNISNRRQIDETLHLETEKSSRYDNPLSIILIDIDHFKRVNDTYGHQIGDEVLKSVAKIMKNNIRKIDFIGRFGGEEFMIICPETGKDGAMSLAEDIRRKVEEHTFDTVNRVTISLGVTTYDKERDDASSLFKKCDAALYLAKDAGRNRVVYQ